MRVQTAGGQGIDAAPAAHLRAYYPSSTIPILVVTSMFSFRLNSRSGVPTYIQLVELVRRGLILGHLRDGDQLPTVREVAAGLVVNPNTVAKAYRELEQLGVVTAHPGQGTFVIGGETQIDPAVRVRLSRRLSAWVSDARSAGLDDEQLRALISVVLDD